MAKMKLKNMMNEKREKAKILFGESEPSREV